MKKKIKIALKMIPKQDKGNKAFCISIYNVLNTKNKIIQKIILSKNQH